MGGGFLKHGVQDGFHGVVFICLWFVFVRAKVCACAWVVFSFADLVRSDEAPKLGRFCWRDEKTGMGFCFFFFFRIFVVQRQGRQDESRRRNQG